MKFYLVFCVLVSFLVASCHGVELTVIVDSSRAPDLRDFCQQVKSSLEMIYPKISDFLDYEGHTSPNQINVTMDSNCTVGGWSGAEHITACAPYYRNHTNEIGNFVELAVYSIEKYGTEPKPDGWWLYGLARYFNRYWFEKKGVQQPESNGKYTDNVDNAAFLINYISTSYGANVIQGQHKEARLGNFKNGAFILEATKKSVDQLWQEVLSKP